MPNINPASFFSGVKAELKKVTWPTKDQVVRLTGVVIIISLIVAFFVGGLDIAFTKIIEAVIK